MAVLVALRISEQNTFNPATETGSPSPTCLVYIESHPLASEREAEVRSHAVWLRICATAVDNHLAIRIESPRCRARRLLWNWRSLGRKSEMIKRD